MANETSTGAPLTATVGERLDEKAHEGDTTGVDRAAAMVEDLQAGGYGEEKREPEARAQRTPTPGRAPARAAAGKASAPGGSRIAWALAAGVGTYVVAGMIGRLFRR